MTLFDDMNLSKLPIFSINDSVDIDISTSLLHLPSNTMNREVNNGMTLQYKLHVIYKINTYNLLSHTA